MGKKRPGSSPGLFCYIQGMAWVHRLSEINAEARTAICQNCGPVIVKLRTALNGRIRYSCASGEKATGATYEATPARQAKSREWIRDKELATRPYIKYKKRRCNRCGYKPPYQAVLDVHHKDGNHRNNKSSNLETLCANCHRLHHYEESLKKKK